MGDEGDNVAELAQVVGDPPRSGRPELKNPDTRPSVSGAYSLAPIEESSTATPHPTSPPANPSLVPAELSLIPLLAMTVSATRHLVSASLWAQRLLDLRLGFELDDGQVRCTDPDLAPRFSKCVSEAAGASHRGQEFHGAFVLRSAPEGWLDVVVAALPDTHSPVAMVIARPHLRSIPKEDPAQAVVLAEPRKDSVQRAERAPAVVSQSTKPPRE